MIAFSAQQIAALLGGRLVGDASAQVRDVAPIESAALHQLSFLTEAKYLPYLATTEAGVILITESLVKDTLPLKEGQAAILVSNARVAMAQLLQRVAKMLNPPRQGVEQPCYLADGLTVPDDAYVGAFAYIGKNVQLGRGVQIYPQCYIGDNCVIGDGSILYAGVRVYYNCVIGKNCILHSGAVIGADGFGFERDEMGVNQKIPQIGCVIIEDDVEIGANTTVDRAMMGSTVVKKNAKLDNLVQVGHGAQVGESTFMCAQSGVAGSTRIGAHCGLGGQVAITDHVEIADGCFFGGQSGVISSIRQPGTYQGTPAIDAMQWRRSSVGFKQLPDLMRRLNELEKK